jgi:ABC-2 type transport system permease protein
MTGRFVWALRRELWENRWLYLAPSAIAVALLLGFVAYAFRIPGTIATLRTLDAAHIHRGLVEPYDIVAGIMMGIGLLIAVIYCVDALYGERRDRSILLWKSLPVSDLETVLAKLSIPIAVLPLICWALTVALHLLMFGISSAILGAHGESTTMLRAETRILPNALGLLYHLVALHGIGFAPIYAWLLLVSAWAPRAPLAWAILPPAAIGITERLAFGTTHFAELLISPLSGGGNGGTSPAMAGGGGLMDELMQPSIGHFLTTPALWIALAITALFVLAATRARRAAQPG